MSYDREKHHRRSVRLKGYDYAEAGAYFITICAQDRGCVFGDIADGQVRLGPAGEVVRRCWEELPKKYPTIELDAFELMPNHLHGIVGLFPLEGEGGETPPLQGKYDVLRPTLGQVMGFFKYESTRGVNDNWGAPGRRLWQRSYFDHVIRNEQALEAIRQYIETNPLRWEADAENPDGNGVDDVRVWVRQWERPAKQIQGGETPPLQSMGRWRPTEGGETPPLQGGQRG
jgi:putative transposase